MPLLGTKTINDMCLVGIAQHDVAVLLWLLAWKKRTGGVSCTPDMRREKLRFINTSYTLDWEQ